MVFSFGILTVNFETFHPTDLIFSVLSTSSFVSSRIETPNQTKLADKMLRSQKCLCWSREQIPSGKSHDVNSGTTRKDAATTTIATTRKYGTPYGSSICSRNLRDYHDLKAASILLSWWPFVKYILKMDRRSQQSDKVTVADKSVVEGRLCRGRCSRPYPTDQRDNKWFRLFWTHEEVKYWGALAR